MPGHVPRLFIGGGAGDGGKKPRHPRISALKDSFLLAAMSFPFVNQQLRHPVAFTRYLLGFKSPKTISLEFRNGMKLTMREYSSDVRVVLENVVWDVYCRDRPLEANRSLTIIDIGGHIGSFAVSKGIKYPQSSIYVFEPFIDNYEILVKNIRQNNLENVHAEMKAVAGKEGTISLNISSGNTGGHSIVYDTGDSIQVKTTTLANIFESNHISKCDLLKMDCEGAEYEILFTTPKEILERISSIIMEYHNSPDCNFIDLKKFLELQGFKITTFGKPNTEQYRIGLLRAERE